MILGLRFNDLVCFRMSASATKEVTKSPRQSIVVLEGSPLFDVQVHV